MANRFKSERHNHRKGGQSRTYTAWVNMLQRCKPDWHQRKDYFDRGISVCDRWLLFDAFLADMGECPASLTLDRKDNDKGYEKSNCRWATHVEQRRNSRQLHRITWQGRTQLLVDWERELGLKRGVLRSRIWRGMALDRAMRPTRMHKSYA